MFTRFAAMVIMVSLLQSEVRAKQHPSEAEAIDRCAKQYEQIVSLFVEYNVFSKREGSQRRLLTVQEWAALGLHYTSIIHWYDNRLYTINTSGSNDQALNWFLWTPSRSVQCFVNRRHCYTWNHLPSKQSNPGFRFYSAIIGCLPPQLQLRSPRERSDIDFDQGVPADVLYFPDFARSGKWVCKNYQDSSYEYTKQTGPFEATMLISADGSKVLERRVSVGGDFSIVSKLSKHKLLKGIWLPWCVSLSREGTADHLEMRVRDLSLNDDYYASKAIGLTIPPGTIVTTNQQETNIGYIPGGVDLLEEVIARSLDALSYWGDSKRGLGLLQMLVGGKTDLWAWRLLALGIGFAFAFLVLRFGFCRLK